MLKLSPGQLSLSQLRAIAAGFDPIVLASECETQVRASAATVRDIVSVGKPAYGINTGFGKLAKVQIPADQLEQLQANLVRSHAARSEEHTSELQPLMRISYAVFCLKKKK